MNTRKHLFHLVNWISRTFFASRLSFAHVQAFIFNNSWRKFANLLHVHWDVWRGNVEAKSKPFICILEVTNVCNLRCPFCLTGKGISGGREVRHMTFEEAKSIIDDVHDSIYLLQLYTWGEPLLNKDFLDIVEYAKRKNIYIMLSTNATAMTPAYCDRLIASGIDYITVAIDGGSDETYEKYRIGGNYTKVLANVRALLERRAAAGVDHPFVEWQFIVFRHNEHEVDATEAMAYAMGVNKFTPLPAYVEDEEWSPRGEKYREAVFNPERLKNCERPWTHLNVRADGGIASCCYEFAKKDDFGEIRGSRFAAIWNNAFFRESRKLIFQHRNKRRLDDSSLICHQCLRTGVRPSYVEVEDVPQDQLNPRRRPKDKPAPAGSGISIPVQVATTHD